MDSGAGTVQTSSELDSGVTKSLADSLSRLLDVDPDTQQTKEAEGHKFGSYCFEELEPAKVSETVLTEVIEPQERNSKTVGCSLNSQTMPYTEDVTLDCRENLHQLEQLGSKSKKREFSQNSQISQELAVVVVNYERIAEEEYRFLDTNKLIEHSENSQKHMGIKITEHEDLREVTLPLKPRQLQELQKNDTYCSDIAKKLHKDVELQKIFIKERGVLHR